MEQVCTNTFAMCLHLMAVNEKSSIYDLMSEGILLHLN